MLNKKHNLKSGNSEDKKKELETKKDRKPKRRENIDEDKARNLIFWCCSFHEREAKKKEKKRKRQKQGAKRKQKGKTRKKKQKEKKKRERQRKRNRKRGRPRKAKGERERNTENIQKGPFLGENKVFLYKQPKNKTKKTTKTNKEGLGPSDTSPDP